MNREPLDLRLAPAALAAWMTAAVGLGWSTGRAVGGAVLLLGLGVALLRWSTRRGADRGGQPAVAGGGVSRPLAAAAAVIAASGALAVAGLHSGAVQAGPIPALAAERAQVTVAGVVRSDPVRREGQFAPYVVVRLTVVKVTGRGVTTRVRSPILVIGEEPWSRVQLGDRVAASGRLQASRGPDLAGVLIGGPPEVTEHAGWVDRGISQVRRGLVEAASPLPQTQRALIPALVDGDDSAMPAEAVEDFQTTGLTHLLAVSGANLTLVLVFVLFVARWCGVRGRGLAVVGMVAVVFFVLLARPQPSVLRAAAMGVVAIAGLSAGGPRRGVRALCVAVVVLVLLDPWLARSVGFLLSTVATAGILLLAPGWRDAMARWMPRLLAEAIAVPLSAQIVCTPVIAAISSEVSLVAVAANLLAAPAVGPTTVLGLIAGLLAVVSETLGHLCGYLAGVPAWWIVWVARHGSELDGASVAWRSAPVAIAALTALCLGVALVMTRLLGNRYACAGVAALLAIVVLDPPNRPGWPPDDWVMVMCDIGQGDGLVLNAGQDVAVVVDTGPEPEAMDRCLDELEVDQVAVVVLTHFHADHVNGLPGVLDGRRVAEIQVSPLSDPVDRAAAVSTWAAQAKVPVTVAVTGEHRRVGQLRWEVIGPVDSDPTATETGEGSAPNNASIVMMVRAQGVRLLLTGDAEPEEELDILRGQEDLRADVLKLAHHGSSNQEPDFIFASRAQLAVVSAGIDNGYGHPSPHTLALLDQLGADLYRTDLDGDIAISVTSSGLAVSTSK